MGTLYLVIAIVLNAGGNFLIKIGADRGISLSLAEGLSKLFTHNGYLIAGIVLFAVNVIFYAAALRTLPLSVVYPLMVGSVFILVGSAAAFFLHESITTWHIVGYALVMLGIVVVSLAGKA